MPSALIEFLAAALVMELTPGPNMTWLALLAARQGRIGDEARRGPFVEIGGRADLLEREDIPRLVAQARDALGPITILVNNAAFTAPGRPPKPDAAPKAPKPSGGAKVAANADARTERWQVDVTARFGELSHEVVNGAGAVGAVLVVGLAVYGLGKALVYMAALHYGLAVGKSEVQAGGKHEALIGCGYAVGPACGLAATAAVISASVTRMVAGVRCAPSNLAVNSSTASSPRSRTA